MVRFILAFFVLFAGAAVLAQDTLLFGDYVNGLPVATTLQLSDQFYVRQNGVSKQISSNLFPGGAGGGGGTIGGGTPGPPPVNSGLCPITDQIGSNTAGVFTTAANCPGDGAFVFTFLKLAAHGWVCFGSDRTNITGPIVQKNSTPTTATFTSGIGIGSVIQFSCTDY